MVDCQLQFEQYRQVLDTLDSQVEQGYLKRFVSKQCHHLADILTIALFSYKKASSKIKEA